MAVDIVPELYADIRTSFQFFMVSDAKIRKIAKRIDAGTAIQADAHEYSVRAGENLSKALRKTVTVDALPNGTLYYNIAHRTVKPALRTNYELVNETAASIQKAIDAADGIGLNSVMAEFPEARINGLLDKMSAGGISAEEALAWLGEPIVNNTQAFYDDYVRANAAFRSKAGMKSTITRTATDGACDWCAGLAGVYEYGDEPDDIYQRHIFCRCRVEYRCERGSYQDVWTKRWYDEDGNALKQRRSVGLDQNQMTAAERLARLPQGRDITREYIRNATPGVGKYRLDEGIPKQSEEATFAKYIFDTLGGDITVKKRSEADGVKSPDFLWNGKLWDLKTTTTEKSANSAIKSGLKQIRENPGGVMLNYGSRQISEDKLLDVIEKRMQWNHIEQPVDILVRTNSGIKVYRY